MRTGTLDSGASIIGWSLAVCCHPYATWRVASPAERLFLALAYFTAGFLLVLGVLLFV